MVRTVGQKVTKHFDEYGKSYFSLRHYAYAPLLNFFSDNETCFNPTILKTVLEIGCGGGAFLKKLSKDFPQIELLVGVDISKTLLKELKSIDNIEAIQADASYLPLKGDYFDLCITVSLLHHIVSATPNLSRKKVLTTLRELLRVSRNKGFIMINENPMLNSRVISIATFWLTRIHNFISLSSPIINFLTSTDVRNIMIDGIKSKEGRLVYSNCVIHQRRSGRYFLESLYYKFIICTYETFFVMKKV